MTQRPTSGSEQFSVGSTMGDTGASSATGSTQPITTGTGSMSTGQSGTSQALDQAKQTASDVTDQAKQQAGQLADQAKQQVSTRLSSQKDRAAESLGSVAQALRQTSQQMRDQNQSGITQYVEQAADQVERFSGYLQQSDVNDIVYSVERYARRQPALFLGGAFVLGLLGARFLKSSSSNSSGNYPIVPRDQYSNRGAYTSSYSDTSYGRGAIGTTGYGSTLGTTSGTSVGSTSGSYGSSTTGSYSSSTGSSYGSSTGTTGTGLAGANTSDSDASLDLDLDATDLGGTTGSSNFGSTSGSRERGGTGGQ